MIQNNLTLRSETLVHIGNGEKYTLLDYFVDNEIMHIVDIDKVFDGIGDIQVIDSLCKDIEDKIINGQAQIDIRGFFSEYRLDVKKYVVKNIKTTIKPSRKVQISQFINQNGNPYLPGSSIKGAIRTAYLFDYYDRNIERLIGILEDPEIQIKDKYKKINEKAIGNIENDMFRYVYVSDSGFIAKEDFTIIEARRYNNIKKQEGNPTYLEVMNEGTDVKFEIKIDNRFKNSFENIASWCNNLSAKIADYEVKNKYSNESTRRYYQELSKKIKEDKSDFFLDIGFGGGHITKAIYLLLWGHNGNKLGIIENTLRTEKLIKGKKLSNFYEFPRTRVLFNNLPIGWVKISKE